MPGGYTADEQTAAKIAGTIADTPSLSKSGTATSTTTAAATVVVTHGLASTPDFVLASMNKTALNGLAYSANTTSITFTRATATTSWTVSYIAGYTA